MLTKIQAALSLLRNYQPMRAPKGMRLRDLVKKFDKQSGGALGGRLNTSENGNRKADEWLVMFIAGMWFQDLWTYDFRRTEMCIIPVRHADGRDLVLRVQHRRRLASHRREDAPERVGGGLVQDARASRRVRESTQERASAGGPARHAQDSAGRRARRLRRAEYDAHDSDTDGSADTRHRRILSERR